MKAALLMTTGFLCMCSGMACSGHRADPQEARVLLWLDSAPVENPYRDLRFFGGSPAASWKEWAEHGRKIKGAEEVLIRLCETDDSPFQRFHILRAMRAIGSQACVPTLLSVLDEDNATDRGMAACALGQIGSPDAIEPLVDLIGTIRWPRRDSEERSFIEAHAAVLKANAISALSRLDRDRARAVIEEELATQNPAPIDKLGLELILKDMESSPHVEGSGQ